MTAKQGFFSGLIGWGVCLIACITLKLFGVLGWDWVWIFAPAWIPLSLIGLMFLLFGILIIIYPGDIEP